MPALTKWLRELYHRVVPAPRRRDMYRALHPREFSALRTAVFPSPKGTFALRRCDELHAIFVHTPKAAGTSIALSIFGELPYHYQAADYIAIFGRETFNRYFTFSFVRNPWDRLYSAYTFLRQGGWDDRDRQWAACHLAHYTDFTDFVVNGLQRRTVREFMHFIPQYQFVCDRRGRLLVDYLGYFETIDADFLQICRHIGIERSLEHTNRSTEKDYRTMYTPQTQAIVNDVYLRDVEYFGYRFDGIDRRLTPP